MALWRDILAIIQSHRGTFSQSMKSKSNWKSRDNCAKYVLQFQNKASRLNDLLTSEPVDSFLNGSQKEVVSGTLVRLSKLLRF